MSVKFLRQNTKDVRFQPGDFIVFPTDQKVKIFPESLKSFIPDSYMFFKQVASHVRANGSDDIGLKAVYFPQVSKPLQIVSVICINSADKLINYPKFFGPMSFVADDDDATIYIFQEMFENYLVNFEAFEFDMETEFQNVAATIVIVNKRKHANEETKEAEVPTEPG